MIDRKRKTAVVLQYTSTRKNEQWQKGGHLILATYWVLGGFGMHIFFKMTFYKPIPTPQTSKNIIQTFLAYNRDYTILL